MHVWGERAVLGSAHAGLHDESLVHCLAQPAIGQPGQAARLLEAAGGPLDHLNPESLGVAATPAP